MSDRDVRARPEDEDRPGAAELDFEATLAELEEIVSRLDGEDVDLDGAIALFRKGLERLEAANAWLAEAEGRVEELIETSSGALETRPFETPDEEG
ncbi:MAG: exodeoxyribonuclease VII small subunit [Gemmatimonadota bacterium]|nr:exodeoxyribonuclease VII small subunit [Gemmatimonadota bacterium]